MLIQANRIDSDGFFVEPVVINNTDVMPADHIKEPVPDGFYKPRWVDGAWVEGADEVYKQAEDSRTVGENPEMTSLRAENEDLKARLASTEAAVLSLMDFV